MTDYTQYIRSTLQDPNLPPDIKCSVICQMIDPKNTSRLEGTVRMAVTAGVFGLEQQLGMIKAALGCPSAPEAAAKAEPKAAPEEEEKAEAAPEAETKPDRKAKGTKRKIKDPEAAAAKKRKTDAKTGGNRPYALFTACIMTGHKSTFRNTQKYCSKLWKNLPKAQHKLFLARGITIASTEDKKEREKTRRAFKQELMAMDFVKKLREKMRLFIETGSESGESEEDVPGTETAAEAAPGPSEGAAAAEDSAGSDSSSSVLLQAADKPPSPVPSSPSWSESAFDEDGEFEMSSRAVMAEIETFCGRLSAQDGNPLSSRFTKTLVQRALNYGPWVEMGEKHQAYVSATMFAGGELAGAAEERHKCRLCYRFADCRTVMRVGITGSAFSKPVFRVCDGCTARAQLLEVARTFWVRLITTGDADDEKRIQELAKTYWELVHRIDELDGRDSETSSRQSLEM